ncbi:MAG: hypothetical protein AAFZ65_03500 [Planctomycetota bacterium]
MSANDPIERLEDLLVLQATAGLDAAEEGELDRLLVELSVEDPEAVERAAAALDLALTAQSGAPMEALPSDLADRILADAPRWLDGPTQAPVPVRPVAPDRTNAPAPTAGDAPASTAHRPWTLVASGWVAAAAAVLFLLWTARENTQRRDDLEGEIARLDARSTESVEALRELNDELLAARAETADARRALEAAETSSSALRDALAAAESASERTTAELEALVATAADRESDLLDQVAELEDLLYVPSPEVRLQRLLESADDVVRVAWNTTPDPLVAGVDVGGEVIWSDSRQEGYMLFDAMRSNAQLDEQFQLWIFSSTQSADTPVDGGVFDVAASAGKVVVPIDAKLAVEDPSLFAITLERPGGVVVSSRERLLLLAEV